MKIFKIISIVFLTLLSLSSCEKYKTYENGRLPFLMEVPDSWKMDESNPVLIKFANSDHTVTISCDIGELSLVRDSLFEDFYDYLYQKHEKTIFDKESIVKTDSSYVLNWETSDGMYVIDGSKRMNGYLCGVQVISSPKSIKQGREVFDRVFQSIQPNHNFIAPPKEEEE